jgi:hypothetical protein
MTKERFGEFVETLGSVGFEIVGFEEEICEFDANYYAVQRQEDPGAKQLSQATGRVMLTIVPSGSVGHALLSS